MVPNILTKPNESQPQSQLENDSQPHLAKLPAEWVAEILRKSNDEIAIRFASGICGYYIMPYRNDDGLKVIYGGPHGPENEPARISIENFRRLQKESEKISLVPKSETPFTYF